MDKATIAAAFREWNRLYLADPQGFDPIDSSGDCADRQAAYLLELIAGLPRPATAPDA